jgi:hypothetical protein
MSTLRAFENGWIYDHDWTPVGRIILRLSGLWELQDGAGQYVDSFDSPGAAWASLRGTS